MLKKLGGQGLILKMLQILTDFSGVFERLFDLSIASFLLALFFAACINIVIRVYN